MDDRTLLEKAAQAAGLQTRPDWFDPLLGVAVVEDMRGPAKRWNPLRDDALALRLMVKLHIEVVVDSFDARVSYVPPGQHPMAEGFAEIYEDARIDPYAATRRAIVRAAAAIADGSPHG